MKGTASCTCEPPFKLFPFPTEKNDPLCRQVWIKNIGRKDPITGQKLAAVSR